MGAETTSKPRLSKNGRGLLTRSLQNARVHRSTVCHTRTLESAHTKVFYSKGRGIQSLRIRSVPGSRRRTPTLSRVYPQARCIHNTHAVLRWPRRQNPMEKTSGASIRARQNQERPAEADLPNHEIAAQNGRAHGAAVGLLHGARLHQLCMSATPNSFANCALNSCSRPRTCARISDLSPEM